MVKPDDTPPSDAFLRLFDADPARAADKCDELFFRLVKFFEWRSCTSPKDLAQDTLLRGFARISSGAVLHVDPVHYLFGVARNIMHEDRKAARGTRDVSLDECFDIGAVAFGGVEARIQLQQCIDRLTPVEKSLLVRYHTEERRELCREFDIPAGVLRLRVHRIRRKLEKLTGKGNHARLETMARVSPYRE
jgi:DNA-directed RNA polymerase specialized sigma24 family protein